MSRYSETSSPNQSRQTPRMLKKSKDTLFAEGEKHELRKSVSTGQLHSPKLLMQQRVLPSATMVSYPVQDPKKFFANELYRLGQSEVMNHIEKAELEGWQLPAFSDREFIEIGIRDQNILNLLKELQLKYRRIPSYHGSNH